MNPETTTPPPAPDRPPRGLLALYVILPVWAAVYLFVIGGLVPPVRLVERHIEGVSVAPDVADVAVDPFADQMRAIIAAVPAEAHDDLPPGPITEAMLQRASTEYRAMCAVCHGPDGRGDGPAGATDPPATSFHSPTRLDEMPRGATFWVIRYGLGMPPRRSAMPAFPALTDEEVWAMVEHLKRLGRQNP
jgi:mono/diheme cytochrome c family protein